MYTSLDEVGHPNWFKRGLWTAMSTAAGAGLYIVGFLVSNEVHHCTNGTATNESEWESKTVTVLGDPFLSAAIIGVGLFSLMMTVQCCMNRKPKDQFERGTRW